MHVAKGCPSFSALDPQRARVATTLCIFLSRVHRMRQTPTCTSPFQLPFSVRPHCDCTPCAHIRTFPIAGSLPTKRPMRCLLPPPLLTLCYGCVVPLSFYLHTDTASTRIPPSVHPCSWRHSPPNYRVHRVLRRIMPHLPRPTTVPPYPTNRTLPFVHSHRVLYLSPLIYGPVAFFEVCFHFAGCAARVLLNQIQAQEHPGAHTRNFWIYC